MKILQLMNSALIGAAVEGGSSYTVTSNTLTVDATPNLSTSTLTAADKNGSTLKPGERVVYTLNIKNTGNGAGTGIQVIDSMNAHSTLDTSTITYSGCGNVHTDSSTTVALNINDILVEVGVNCVITYETIITSPLNEGTTIQETANIHSASEGGLGAIKTSNQFTIDSTPSLSVQTSDDTTHTVYRNQTVNMQIKITNSGDGDATGVSMVYNLSSLGENLTYLSETNCGNSMSQNKTGNTITFSNLNITTTSICILNLSFTVSNSSKNNDQIIQTADAGQASEGGNNPALVNSDVLTVDISNEPPNTPSSVTSANFTNNKKLSLSAITGSNIIANLTDPNEDQVKFEIEIATENTFSSPVIDYISNLGSQGSRIYTYKENSGTYAIGNSNTTLEDGPYYIRIRNIDEHGANSSWYVIPGIAFTFDTTPPITPTVPVLQSTTQDGTALVTWDATMSQIQTPTYHIELKYLQLLISLNSVLWTQKI
jgi:uncharacterized repeat protein (TIGR01451 family)